MKKLAMIIIVLVVLIVFGGVYLFSNWNNSYYNGDCLKEIAIGFCEDKNFTFDSGYATKVEFLREDGFYCEKEPDDLRKSKYKRLEYFYFLEDELKGCIK